MVEQVNRMVGNLLAWNGEAALPGVGSLYVERQAARRLSKRSVLPPSCVVSFTSQMRGASLVATIAATAQCDEAQAQEIYGRWLSHTQQGDTLTIENVGVLKFKNFTLDPAFDRLLNPQGHEPVRIRSVRRFDWVLWFGVTVIALVMAAGAALWLTDGSPLAGLESLWGEDDATEELVQSPALAAPSASEEFGSAASGEKSDQIDTSTLAVGVVGAQSAADTGTQAAQNKTDNQPSVKSADVQAAPAQSGSPESPASLVAGRRYVVLGVFSTAENAARAIADAVAKDSSIRCSVYRFGAKLMVSPFDAADAESCTQFIRDKADRFPGMWTHTAK